MKKDTSHIAVLFFSRSASAEAQNKIFTVDNHSPKNDQLAQQLISHSRKQIVQSGLPFIEFDEQLQQGHDFGERFAHAFTTMFEMGYQHVIAVGNDTPELCSGHIEQAADLLLTGKADIILGPAKDGGTWLTAYTKEAFDERNFRQHPWQEKTLCSSLIQRYSEQFSVTTLELLADIDDAHTLQSFIQRTSHKFPTLVCQLQSILATILSFGIEDSPPELPYISYRNNRLRAPPLG
ncbi:TIGR04282 family arsenosugar biosynthesis glycosyltransferase [Fodinibius saliphilus]|uniref:TIGR04282 family arsenosugar biosynthesis glycosyltransferase n=1 Tax=Fodinibius saliphilus TaxID=1920650 RepID=UPI0014861EFF|nr:DUF2064 domain-containing protein [Fodinibius saliphilus]